MTMNSSEIYRHGYKFAKEQHSKRVKNLKIVSLSLFGVILLVICAGVFNSLDLFKKKQESVTQVFEEKTQEEDQELKALIQEEQSYANAKIPYDDPEGKFSIFFMTPYVSDEIGIAIYKENEYDEIKKTADKIVQNAKLSVPVNSVTYIKNFR